MDEWTFLHVAYLVTHHSHGTKTCEATHLQRAQAAIVSDWVKPGSQSPSGLNHQKEILGGWGGGVAAGRLAFIASPLWFYTDLPVCGSAASGWLLSWQGSGV